MEIYYDARPYERQRPKYVRYGMSVRYMPQTWLLIFKVYCCNFKIDLHISLKTVHKTQ